MLVLFALFLYKSLLLSWPDGGLKCLCGLQFVSLQKYNSIFTLVYIIPKDEFKISVL